MVRADVADQPVNCPACGEERNVHLWHVHDRLFQTTDERFAIRRCGGCGLRFLHPNPTPQQLARYYPGGYWVGPAEGPAAAGGGTRARLTEVYRRLVLRDQVRFVRRAAAEQVARGAWTRMLDIGCGDGSVLAACDRRPAAGLDLSTDAARAVRARGFDAVQGDPHALPFPRGSFSLVTMFHFLEHVNPAGPVLAQVRELLRDDGDLVVQVPNHRCAQARLLGRRWAGYDPPRHLMNHTPATLRATLARAGFRVVRTTQFSIRDNPTTLANSIAPGLYPPARAARRAASTRGARAWLGDLAYLGLTMLAVPLTLVESALGFGATVMVQAKKSDGPVTPA